MAGIALPAVMLACLALVAAPANAQTWTSLMNQPLNGVNLCMLLTDGSVICQANLDYNLSTWYKLTPDIHGSYLNGAWSSIASMPSGYVPYAAAEAVLADGRVVMVGGEYNNNQFALTNMGAVYDPVADNWTLIAPPPSTGSPNHFQCIGDAPSTVLADGRLIIGSKLYQDLAILDPSTLTWTLVNSTGKIDTVNSEEGWTLLPDGSFFTIDVTSSPASERFLLTGPATGMWVSSGDTPQVLTTPGETYTLNAPGCPPYMPVGEIGPQLLTPSGTVFAIGADGNTGIYTPPAAGSTAAGSWAEGPAFGLTAEDAPGAVLPSGHVLFGGSPSDAAGLQYFEFDGENLINVPPPPSGSDDATGDTSLLLLPTGEVLFVDGDNAFIYDAAATPTYDPSWAPTITSVPLTISAGATYQISGTQFNGLDQGTAYGDEFQNSTNYPLVRITNNATGHVFYARTHDHSSMGVATGSAMVSTYFDVPPNIEAGASLLEVVANGIPSVPAAVTMVIPSGGAAPVVTTGSASAVTSYSATLSGSVNPDGADTQVWFEYSTNSSMSGSVYTAQQDAGSGMSAVAFSARIGGLTGLTNYYYRALASNNAGTSQGSIATFTQATGAAGYNDLGPFGSFSTYAWCVNGANNAGCGPAQQRIIAAPFTPSATVTLESISVELNYFAGTNAAQITLAQDAGGLPGNTLESWTVNNVTSDLPPQLTTVNDKLSLMLQAGQQYWVVVAPTTAGTDTLLYWFENGVGLPGVYGQFGNSGWFPLPFQPAFEVSGSPLAPAVNSGGVVSASDFGEFTTVSPGDWMEIYGTNLAPDSRTWTASDFTGVYAPIALDGTSVTIGGLAAFVSFISPGQVNAQVPFGVSAGSQPLIVTTAAGAAGPYAVNVKAEAPGLLAPPSFTIGGDQYVVALFPDYTTYVLPAGAIAGLNSRPAQPGDTIILYGVGFGAVMPTIPAGQMVEGANTLAAPFKILIGGAAATVSYDGLAPGYVGLYQFNVVVPQIPTGNLVPLTFTLNGTQGTQTLYLAIQ